MDRRVVVVTVFLDGVPIPIGVHRRAGSLFLVIFAASPSHREGEEKGERQAMHRGHEALPDGRGGQGAVRAKKRVGT
jgi:hypothetical protein